VTPQNASFCASAVHHVLKTAKTHHFGAGEGGVMGRLEVREFEKKTPGS